MLKLFRYLKKAYVPVIAIVLLLILQASCDLTLPTFTSNIVNVGIQQKGIEDAVPDVMREETFLALKSLMKQDDADDMEDAYKLYTKDQVKDSKYKDYKDGRLYVRRYISKKDREHLDTSMSKAMLKLSAQMADSGQSSGSSFFKQEPEKNDGADEEHGYKRHARYDHQSGSDFFCDFRIQSNRT